MLSNQPFETFCTNLFGHGLDPYGNLESVHDGVHLRLGGRHGHMSHVSHAAFDPVFWLHHV